MHIKNIDLNLLVVADALFKHKNVSRAAHDLGLSQSALSHALGRLRTQFKDPFFVRTSKGVMPTEFARSIHPEIIEIIRRAQQLATHKTAFLPIHAKGRITLATSDYVESVVMPRLLPILHKEAPGLQISLRPTAGELPKKELEEGKIDLAIAGFYRQLPEGFYQSKLFTDEFRVASAKSSAQFGPQLSREDYYSARHALITLQGDFHDDLSQKIGKKKVRTHNCIRIV
jgi:DNA-binding transcriptional LysR family regulator